MSAATLAQLSATGTGGACWPPRPATWSSRSPSCARAASCRRSSSPADASTGPCTRSSWRRMWPGCPPAQWMISSPLWAQSRGSPSLRCHASARGSTTRSRRSVPAGWITSSSPTCISTPPTSTCATASRSPPRWRRWSPPASQQRATERSWDVTSATARARGSGSSSWARCATGASQVCAW